MWFTLASLAATGVSAGVRKVMKMKRQHDRAEKKEAKRRKHAKIEANRKSPSSR